MIRTILKNVLLDSDGRICGAYVYVICDRAQVNGLMQQTEWYFASEIEALQVANANQNYFIERIPTKSF